MNRATHSCAGDPGDGLVLQAYPKDEHLSSEHGPARPRSRRLRVAGRGERITAGEGADAFGGVTSSTVRAPLRTTTRCVPSCSTYGSGCNWAARGLSCRAGEKIGEVLPGAARAALFWWRPGVREGLPLSTDPPSPRTYRRDLPTRPRPRVIGRPATVAPQMAGRFVVLRTSAGSLVAGGPPPPIPLLRAGGVAYVNDQEFRRPPVAAFQAAPPAEMCGTWSMPLAR